MGPRAQRRDVVGGAGDEGEPIGGGLADDDAVDGVLELAEEGIDVGGSGGGGIGLVMVEGEAGLGAEGDESRGGS